ncbi:MAG: RidA family protein [Succinivibrionaceae bacterium]|nr:RidA family protein [Succinivibrionaceae bacterium]
MQQVVATKNAPAAIGPYVQGRVAGGFLFASGQIPIDPRTGELVAGDIRAQARQALLNVKAVVEAAGASMDDVVKTTCFLRDLSDFAPFNEVYAEFFGTVPPARSCVGGIAIPKGALCEVEVVVSLV